MPISSFSVSWPSLPHFGLVVGEPISPFNGPVGFENMSRIHGVLGTDNLAFSQNTHLPPQFLSGKGMFNHPRDSKNGKLFPNLDGIARLECQIGRLVRMTEEYKALKELV